MIHEESFFVLQLPSGQYVGPRVTDYESEGTYAMTRYNKETFMKAQRYKTERNAKLASRYFKGCSIKEIKVTYEG